MDIMRKLALLILLGFIIIGCPVADHPYYSRFSGHGLVFSNSYGTNTECSRNFLASNFRGVGTIQNTNSFGLYVEVERVGYRNTATIGSFVIEAGQQISYSFTAGDMFRAKLLTGEPVGVIVGNVLFRENGVERVYRGKL